MSRNRSQAGPFYAADSLAHISAFLPPDGNTYVNAAFVDTFLAKAGAIVTQAPMQNTVEHFWALVLEHNVRQIIMLNADHCQNEDAPDYWPEGASASIGSKATYGDVNVEIVGMEQKNMVKYKC